MRISGRRIGPCQTDHHAGCRPGLFPNLPEQDGCSDASGRVIARMPEGGMHLRTSTTRPFREKEEDLYHIEELYPEHMWTGVASPPGPSVSEPSDLAAGAHTFRAKTDRAIVGLFGGNLLEMGQFFYRMDNFLMILAGEPHRAHRSSDALVDVHLRHLERVPFDQLRGE